MAFPLAQSFLWHKFPANCDAHLPESDFKHALAHNLYKIIFCIILPNKRITSG